MTQKDALKWKLSELPQAFQDVLGAQLPALDDVTMPTTVEGSIIKQGELAAYLLEVFDRLAGLPVLEVPLRVGQLVPALQAMAALSMEFLEQASYSFTVVNPVENVTYHGNTDFMVEVAEDQRGALQAITVDVDEEMLSLTFNEDDQVYQVTHEFTNTEIQEFTAVFTATFTGDLVYTASVLFSAGV